MWTREVRAGGKRVWGVIRRTKSPGSQLNRKQDKKNQDAGHLCLFSCLVKNYRDFPIAQVVKEFYLQCKRLGFNPWVRKIPWRRKWQLTPVFLPGEPHGQRSLVGYSPRSHKESDTTKLVVFAFHTR